MLPFSPLRKLIRVSDLSTPLQPDFQVFPQFYMPRVMLLPKLAVLMIYKYFIMKCIKHAEYYRETHYQCLSTHRVRSVYFAIFALDFFFLRINAFR